MAVSFYIVSALLLDKKFAEPEKNHPLVFFGNYASTIKSYCYQKKISRGIIAWCLAVIPYVLFFNYVDKQLSGLLSFLFSALVLYICIAWQSLMQHAESIIKPLKNNNIVLARSELAKIVSRDTSELSEQEIVKASTESVLENGADAIFNAIFWFIIAGVPGVVLYRLANTLDAMWGYKNEQYLLFGRCAARIDDVLNYIPARLTALSYAAVGDTAKAMVAWQSQAKQWKSPNAGPVMAAGAGALNASLGGAAVYHGSMQERPVLGVKQGFPLTAELIENSLELVMKSLLLWCLVIALIEFMVF